VERKLPKRDPLLHAIYEKEKEENPNIAERTIRDRIKKFRTKHRIISRKMAKYAYAVIKHNIDIQKFLKDESERKELQELLTRIPQQSQLTETRREKGIKKRQRLISKKIVDSLGLPSNLSEEANRMTEAYQAIYVFENLIRHVVMRTLEKKYGKDWWNTPNVVSREIKKLVENRKLEERRNRWHTKRGSHNIFYTDFKDLDRIITTNIKDFKNVFGDLEIQAEMRQLERSRNIIAHSNPLPHREVERIKLYLKDLLKQLNIYLKYQ